MLESNLLWLCAANALASRGLGAVGIRPTPGTRCSARRFGGDSARCKTLGEPLPFAMRLRANG